MKYSLITAFVLALVASTSPVNAQQGDLIALPDYLNTLRAQLLSFQQGDGEDQTPVRIAPVQVRITTVAKKADDGTVELYVVAPGGNYDDLVTQQISTRISLAPTAAKREVSDLVRGNYRPQYNSSWVRQKQNKAAEE